MEPAINIALRAARAAGDLIAKASERMDLVKIEEKERNDFVSNVDKAAEAEIVSQLRKAWPDDNIMCEEGGLITGASGHSDTTWYVDPLDGTTNFLRGIPHYAVSIGCVKNGRHEHAVIYDPIRREEFTASRGRGASLNGKRLRVSAQVMHNTKGSKVRNFIALPFRYVMQRTHPAQSKRTPEASPAKKHATIKAQNSHSASTTSSAGIQVQAPCFVDVAQII